MKQPPSLIVNNHKQNKSPDLFQKLPCWISCSGMLCRKYLQIKGSVRQVELLSETVHMILYYLSKKKNYL